MNLNTYISPALYLVLDKKMYLLCTLRKALECM